MPKLKTSRAAAKRFKKTVLSPEVYPKARNTDSRSRFRKAECDDTDNGFTIKDRQIIIYKKETSATPSVSPNCFKKHLEK